MIPAHLPEASLALRYAVFPHGLGLSAQQLRATDVDLPPVLMLVAALGLYLWGVGRVNRLQPRHRWPVGRTVAWVGALFVTAIAIFSFVGAWDGNLFWDHMVQHLLLLMVAAPLYALGSPLDLLWRASTGKYRRLVATALRSRPSTVLANPIVAYLLYAVTIPLTHLTQWYNFTLTHETVHDTEHLLYLVVGYLFWRQIFGSDPNRYRMHSGLRLLFLFLAVPIDTFTGLSLDTATHEIFPAYLSLASHHLAPVTGGLRLQDLHVGGVIMWVGGDTLMLWPMLPVVLDWIHRDERRAVRIDRQLDAMLPERRTVEPVANGVGSGGGLSAFVPGDD